jgi:hypothetical protein
MLRHILWIIVAIIWVALLLSYTVITLVVSTSLCFLYQGSKVCDSINGLRLSL